MIIGTSILDSLNVIYKWLQDNEFLSPSEIGGLEGLFSFIILLILNIAFSLLETQCFIDFQAICDKNKKLADLNNTFSSIFDKKEKVLALIFGSIICSGFYTLFTLLTNKYLNPTYKVFLEISYYLYNNISKKNEYYYIRIGSLILSIIGSLTYAEVITFNCFSLNYNTRKSISERATLERSVIEGEERALFPEERSEKNESNAEDKKSEDSLI